MPLGVTVGLLLHATLAPADARAAADVFSLVTRAFLRLIQMIIAPLVFSTLTAAVARTGGRRSIGRMGLRAPGSFLGASAVSLARGAGWAATGRTPGRVIRAMRQPLLIALSTTSSETAYPRTLEALEASGVRGRVVSFVLPLGYAFNLDGAILYATFAVPFIA